MIAKLPLVPFVIINFKRLTAGVCTKVRFKSKVTRDFTLSRRFTTRLLRSRLKKTSGTGVLSTLSLFQICVCALKELFYMLLRRTIELIRALFKREVEIFPLKKWYNN